MLFIEDRFSILWSGSDKNVWLKLFKGEHSNISTFSIQGLLSLNGHQASNFLFKKI